MGARDLLQAEGDARLRIDPDAGGRLAQLSVGGRDLLVDHGPAPTAWGCFPMAPWAGRVRDGRFVFDGAEQRMPLNFGEHAIHGTVFDVAWEVAGGPTHLVTKLVAPWPWSGEVHQHVTLAEDRLDLRLEIHAFDSEMPASCGWHPWFRRELGSGPVRLELDAGHMLLRDEAGITTAERVEVPDGPWDDCFGNVTWPVVLEWPELRIEIDSTCSHVVVYDEPAHAVCVEPQTAPPDALNNAPFIVEPGRPLIAESTWRWQPQ